MAETYVFYKETGGYNGSINESFLSGDLPTMYLCDHTDKIIYSNGYITDTSTTPTIAWTGYDYNGSEIMIYYSRDYDSLDSWGLSGNYYSDHIYSLYYGGDPGIEDLSREYFKIRFQDSSDYSQCPTKNITNTKLSNSYMYGSGVDLSAENLFFVVADNHDGGGYFVETEDEYGYSYLVATATDSSGETYTLATDPYDSSGYPIFSGGSTEVFSLYIKAKDPSTGNSFNALMTAIAAAIRSKASVSGTMGIVEMITTLNGLSTYGSPNYDSYVNTDFNSCMTKLSKVIRSQNGTFNSVSSLPIAQMPAAIALIELYDSGCGEGCNESCGESSCEESCYQDETNPLTLTLIVQADSRGIEVSSNVYLYSDPSGTITWYGVNSGYLYQEGMYNGFDGGVYYIDQSYVSSDGEYVYASVTVSADNYSKTATSESFYITGSGGNCGDEQCGECSESTDCCESNDECTCMSCESCEGMCEDACESECQTCLYSCQD